MVKTKSPKRSVVKSTIKRAVTPKGIVERIVKSPAVIKISPWVVIDIIDFSSAGLISPRSLRIYLNIGVSSITGVVVSICKNILLWVV
jgi:hypothetical protein